MVNDNANWDPGFAAGLADTLTSDLDSHSDLANWEGDGGFTPAHYDQPQSTR